MTPTTNTNWFTHTSDKPYDRHYYTINDKRFDDYDHMRAYWFQTPTTRQPVLIHDLKHKPKTKSGGFA
tara:strand:- start:2709 stop:2912 length:204 start_codon:yes stop_codon:yes gene_type:complete